MQLFFVVFYQPIYNLLIWLYDVVPGADMGVAIILVTLIIKLITLPLTHKSLVSQKYLSEIQPKIDEVKEKFKDDKEKQAKELMAVYKEHKVNPLASCLPLLIQLPIFIALFQALRDGIGAVHVESLYPFINNPGTVDAMFLGFVDLAKVSIPLAVLAAVSQYFQAKQTISRRVTPKKVAESAPAKDEDMLASMNKTMLYMVPAMTLFIGSTSLPGGVMLYWFTTTILTYIQYALILGKPKKTEPLALTKA